MVNLYRLKYLKPVEPHGKKKKKKNTTGSKKQTNGIIYKITLGQPTELTKIF